MRAWLDLRALGLICSFPDRIWRNAVLVAWLRRDSLTAAPSFPPPLPSLPRPPLHRWAPASPLRPPALRRACLLGVRGSPVPLISASFPRSLLSLSLSVFLSWWRRLGERRRYSVFVGPFAGDERPRGMPSPSLPFLLCETEHPKP